MRILSVILPALTRCHVRRFSKCYPNRCSGGMMSNNDSRPRAAPTDQLEDYTPPEWAQRLKYAPKHRVKLTMYNTPIHPWNVPGVPSDFQLCIKRDDMTGSSLSGNKVRKLEFLLAEAVKQGCTSVITCGGIQSNFARCTAVAARQLGMESHLFLRSTTIEPDSIGCQGNLLLNRMVGAHIYLIPKLSKYEADIKGKMYTLAEKIESTGGKAFLVPVGGSTKDGLYGYLENFNEMLQQNILDNFDDVIVTIGSSGTAAGLAIGNYLTGSKLKCHAIAVCDDANYFHSEINHVLKEVGLNDETKSEDIIDVIEGAKGRGYGVSTQEELDFILEVGATTGVMVDPVYTGKAIKCLVHEMKTNPSRFQGRRSLFVHTGGIFGLFDGRMDSVLKSPESVSNRVYSWMDDDTITS
ncbi:uncharacterized protein LOC144442367 [Glandiceps talaboti]